MIRQHVLILVCCFHDIKAVLYAYMFLQMRHFFFDKFLIMVIQKLKLVEIITTAWRG